MEALFDLNITIIKVYLISYLYVKLYCIIIEKFKTVKFISYLPKIEKKKNFTIIRVIISISLILFSFTYWGNKGYGDESLIPIGNYKHVEKINGIQAYIDPEQYKYGALNIEKFQITKNLVFGEAVGSPVDSPPPFFVWNFKTEEFLFFDNEANFKFYLGEKKILKYSLKSFDSNYVNYWNIRMILMA